MNKKQLLARLEGVSDDTEIMILDGSNGGGYPRTINSGPSVVSITKDDADNSGDCEDFIGKSVVVIGYGCY